MFSHLHPEFSSLRGVRNSGQQEGTVDMSLHLGEGSMVWRWGWGERGEGEKERRGGRRRSKLGKRQRMIRGFGFVCLFVFGVTSARPFLSLQSKVEPIRGFSRGVQTGTRVESRNWLVAQCLGFKMALTVLHWCEILVVYMFRFRTR